MVLYQREPRIGEPVSNRGVKTLRKRTHKRDAVDVGRLNSGCGQASLQRMFGQVAFGITTCDFSFFRRRCDDAVTQYRGGRIAMRTANSNNDHELLSALLNLGPGIPKADRTVENQTL